MSKRMFSKQIFALELWLALIFACFAGSSSADSKRNLDFFLKKTDYIDVKLSPDGKTYFAHVRGEGGSYLVFVDRFTKKPISSIKAKPDDLIYDYHWIDNSEVIYRYGRSVWWSDRPYSRGSIVRYNLERKRTNTVTWGRSDLRVLSTKKLENGKLLTASWDRTRSGRVRPYIGKLKPSGGWSTIESLPMAGAFPVASKNGTLHFFNLNDQESNYSSYYRASTEDEWAPIPTEALGSQCAIEFVSYQAENAYINCDAGERGIQMLFEWKAESQAATPVFPEATISHTNVIRDPETGEASVGVFDTGKVEYIYREGSAFAQEFKRLVNAFSGQRVSISSQSDDGQLIVLRVRSDTNPGEFYLYDRRTKKADFLMAVRSWMGREQLQAMEHLQFEARDGLAINAYLTRAKDKSSTKLIVYPHGGPHSIREFWGFDEGVQLLSAQGFNVLQVNFRGSSGYGESFRAMGYEKWGTAMVDDVVDATRFAQSLGLGANGDVCIMGGSYGAYSSLMATVRAPNLYRCAIGYAGVYDLPMIYKDDRDTSYWRRDSIQKKGLGDDLEGMAAMSPANHAEKISAKIFLIHGKRDFRTPLEQAELMRDALSDAGNKPQWLVFRDSGHGMSGNKERYEYYSAVLEFLNENIH